MEGLGLLSVHTLRVSALRASYRPAPPRRTTHRSRPRRAAPAPRRPPPSPPNPTHLRGAPPPPPLLLSRRRRAPTASLPTSSSPLLSSPAALNVTRALRPRKRDLSTKCDWNCNLQIRVWTNNLNFKILTCFWVINVLRCQNPQRFKVFPPEVANPWRFQVFFFLFNLFFFFLVLFLLIFVFPIPSLSLYIFLFLFLFLCIFRFPLLLGSATFLSSWVGLRSSSSGGAPFLPSSVACCCLVSSFSGWCCEFPLLLRGAAWFLPSLGGVAVFPCPFGGVVFLLLLWVVVLFPCLL